MNPKKLARRILNIMSYINLKELHPKNTVTFFGEVDCTIIESLRSQCFQETGVKPSYTAFIAQAVAQTVKQHPYTNARVFPGLLGKFIYKFDHIDIGVANEKDYVGVEYLAFMDIIRDVDKTSLISIQEQLAAIAKCDESNNQQLRDFLGLAKYFPSWLGKRLAVAPAYFPKLWKKYRGAGIIISSPAKYGVDCLGTTWTHTLGISFGLVKKKPMVKDGSVQPVLSFTLTLNFDRRVIAGAPAARFFHQLIQNLNNPIKEFTLQNKEKSPENLSSKVA